MSETPQIDPNALCRVCRGKFEDHKNTIHAFTPLDGDLVTKEQAVKRVRDKQKPPAKQEMATEEFKRLLSVLKTKGLLEDSEVMFVLLGPPDLASIKTRRPSPEGP